MRYRDISSQVVEIGATGCPYELDDGRLVTCYKGPSPTFVGRIGIASPPYTSWSDLAVDTGVAQIGRYFYRAANGYLYFATARDGFFGRIIRSTDGGNTWAVVHQGTAGDQIWSICENSAGELFANSYGQASNLGVLAKEVYKSTDDGATWDVWLTVPDTVSGQDAIRHVHGVFCDSDDNMLISCGEWNSFTDTGATASWSGGYATITKADHHAIEGGIVRHTLFSNDGYNGDNLPIFDVPSSSTYRVAMADPGGTATGGQIQPQFYNGAIRHLTDNGASGTIGDVISYDGNGWLKMLETATGRKVFGWDTGLGIVPAMMDITSTLWARQARMHDEIPGAEWGGYGYDGCIGRDGVLYFLMTFSSVPSCVYASADDGVTWQVLDLGLGVAYEATNITCNPDGPSGMIFISGNGNNIKMFPDFTRAQLRQRAQA